jgi:hypothetical protein
MKAINNLPEFLQADCDEVVAAFNNGKTAPKNLEKIKEWLEVDGWDDLIADLGEQMAIDLADLSQFDFNDQEARDSQDIPDDLSITDEDRIRWGRNKIDSVLSEYDDCLLPSLHTYTLKASDGSTATIGCLVEIHGQSGPVCEWQGMWSSREEFLDSFSKGGKYWVTPLMGDVPDEVILSIWQKPI